MKSIASLSSLGGLRSSVPWSSSDASSCTSPSLPFGSEALPGPDQQPHADRRLLVMEDRHHLQAVGERLDLIGREVDVAGGQRPRRPLRRPVARLRRRRRRTQRADARRTAPQTRSSARRERVGRLSCAPCCPSRPAPRPPGIERQHQAVFRREIGARHALHVARPSGAGRSRTRRRRS